MKEIKKENSLAVTHPELANEWHPTKNGDLTPYNVTTHSNKKVWWICKVGHEWCETVNNRVGKKCGCPYCSGHKVIVGKTDLATTHPELAKEWHPTKNEKLTPSDVSYGSGKKVWWQCEHGHEWQATISSRAIHKNSCPYCSGHMATNENNLATKYPELAKEWHPTKNGNLTPYDVTPKSDKKVWWVCDKGHEWETRVKNRTRGNNCPYCSGNLTIIGENDLATTHPEIAKQWHPTKNGNLKPTDVKVRSKRTIWWICECGCEWEDMVIHRYYGHNCPQCGNHHPSKYKTINDLPKRIVAQWHPTKNEKLTPDSCGVSKQVWWICEKGHEYHRSISERISGQGCPYCSGKKVLSGFNDLATKRPDLAKEWHPTKNGKLKPTQITAGNGKKVWWQCEHGHEWFASPNQRRKQNCPYCSGHRIIVGENDFATKYPELAKEWHPTKNGVFTPENFSCGSNEKVWWKCSKGHEWQAKIQDRTKGKGCPYCSGRRVIVGKTDLATTHPELAKEWHPTKNGKLKPQDVSFGSSKKVWWQCEHGHEWQAIIGSRKGGLHGCPYCSSAGMSMPEMAIMYEIQKHTNIKLIHRNKDLGFELDVYIPSLKVGIEYDGVRFHNDKKLKDLAKNKLCKENGITIYRIREKGLQKLNDKISTDIYCKPGNNKSLSTAISMIMKHIFDIDVQINIDEDQPNINSLFATKMVNNSLLLKKPNLAKEWHPTKNGKLKPEHVSVCSGKNIWWQCEHGHEWQASPSSRRLGSGCPYCSGNRVIVGKTDLATTHPELAKQWHPTKNGDLTPKDVSFGSGKKVWWICEHGHEWESTITNRTVKNSICPYCSGKRILQGFNDLATTHPDIAKQWHPTKNGDLKPTMVTYGSGKKVWWINKYGKEVLSKISSKTQSSKKSA